MNRSVDDMITPWSCSSNQCLVCMISIEVTARAITYYLDVSNECTRRITQVDGAVKAICSRLAAADLAHRASKDLGKYFL